MVIPKSRAFTSQARDLPSTELVGANLLPPTNLGQKQLNPLLNFAFTPSGPMAEGKISTQTWYYESLTQKTEFVTAASG